MTVIALDPSIRPSHAIRHLAELAKRDEQTYASRIHGIVVVVTPGDKPRRVLKEFQARRAELVQQPVVFSDAMQTQECHLKKVRLLVGVPKLNYADMEELIQFFRDITDIGLHEFECDWIVGVFERRGFAAGANCGSKFDSESPDNFARYVIGQGLSNLARMRAISDAYYRFADEWHDKFAAA